MIGELWEWATRQLEESDLSDAERAAVTKLLTVVWSEGGEADPLGQKTVIEAFNKLVAGHALKKIVEDPRWRWEPVKPGRIVVREWVRVKHDAYNGDTGQMHNGREGRVVAIRHGDIHVAYEDGGKKPSLAVRHSPHNLEKRISA